MMEDPKNIKEELTEDELKVVSGGDGAVAVPENPLGSPAKELTDDELKGQSGGGKDATEQSVNNWIDERIHFLDPSA